MKTFRAGWISSVGVNVASPDAACGNAGHEGVWTRLWKSLRPADTPVRTVYIAPSARLLIGHISAKLQRERLLRGGGRGGVESRFLLP
jgi:hypothetical protein